MLSLITHEPNFCILREEVFNAKRKKQTDTGSRNTLKLRDNFEMIYISILREYLEMEFLEIKEKKKFEFNIDRIIDDFVFFCFFIGNDFLPSLNTLDIDNASLDNIFSYYKQVLPTLDGYITCNGKIDFKKAEKIFHLLATQELNSLRSMLKKVELQSKEREAVKSLQIAVRKSTIMSKKINEKKEILFFEWKKKTEGEIFAYKKHKINTKVIDIKKKYEEEMKISGKEALKFEDDFNTYVKENQRKMLDDLALKRKKDEFSSEFGVNNIEETSPDAEGSEAGKIKDLLTSDNQSNTLNQINNNNNNINNNTNTESDSKKLCLLFHSDDEASISNKNKGGGGEWKKSKFTNYKTKNKPDPASFAGTNTSLIGAEKASKASLSPKARLNLIFKEAEHFKNYIHDENYCSDFNIMDIYDDDISEVSETELVVDQTEFLIDYEKEYEESQNVDHVFQKKLVEYYITDISKAKAFYYKEKVKIDLETEEGKQQIKQMFRKYFEGLQWVLYYYYRGIQTWRWYYPYHYPPMISDFVNIEDYLDYDLDSVFARDKAYSPLESLVLILPNSSRDLIPKCLWTVYDEFLHFFPTNFQIDFNGKKMPWESLVLLPFIEDGELIKAVNCKIKFFADEQNFESLQKIENETALALKLSEKELQRNIKGKSYIIRLVAGSTDAKILEEIEFEIYEENLDQKVFSGNYANNKKLMHDFPTLKSIQYNFSSSIKKIHGFNKETNRKIIIKKENIIALEPIAMEITEKDVGKFIKNGIVFADYPMKKEGWIRGIYFNNQYYYTDRKGNVCVDNAYKLPITVREAIMRLCGKKSIVVKSGIFCDIVFIKKIARNSDGSIFKIYKENSSLFVPFELTSLNSNSEDFYKIIENFEDLRKKFFNVETEFDYDKPVIALCKNAWGRIGKINGVVENSDNEYKKFLELNYDDYYDEKFNVDLKGNDWNVELEQLYNGPLLEVALESPKNVTGQEVSFAKKVINRINNFFLFLKLYFGFFLLFFEM
jgi:5'-3' exonuclease